ncbi:glycosyltransferase involved in cell wall biosynthesis [Oxalobacteraceae bacterium GrIS 1.11]
MKIVILGPGNSIHVSRWCNAISARGNEVHLISEHEFDRSEYSGAVKFHMLPFRGGKGYFLNRAALRALLGKIVPDLVNCHYASGYGTMIAKLWRGPMLLSVWGADVYEFPYQSRFKMWLIRRNLLSATHIASTSHVMADQVRRICPEIGDISVTPFGIDPAIFVPAQGARNAGQVVIGTVKTMAKKYGIDILIRGFSLLLERLMAERSALAVNIKLLLVGGGPDTAALQALVAELGLGASVEFVGQVAHAEVPRWLARLDIYVAVSRNESESFGVAVLEASSCGLPVVVSRVGGLPEVVAENVTGLLIPNESPQGLADALHLLLDEPKRLALGRAGREWVCEHFSWEYSVDLMLQAYAKTVQGAPETH